MGRRARQVVLDRMSPGERFDRGLDLSHRVIESYLGELGESHEPGEGEVLDPETRRRRFEALRGAGD